eukprot:TRINITY_DN26658_c0_g1_i1.p1 TRINITY_DN26658_c0_g1~~TRINITY_DN26658_c0_g1_i1.p1  ORF type:complete len:237 (-),score=48.42 TRINITY_DN26658_c0_g1_i1:364-1074(-)
MKLWLTLVKPAFTLLGGAVTAAGLTAAGIAVLTDEPIPGTRSVSRGSRGSNSADMPCGRDELWSQSQVMQALGVCALVSVASYKLHLAWELRRARREVARFRNSLTAEVQQHIQVLEGQHRAELRMVRAQVDGFQGPIHHPPALVAPAVLVEQEPPEWAVCPISFELMTQPVCLPSGASYNLPAIARWIEQNNIDPTTRQPLSLQHVYPNLRLRERIQNWIQQSTANLLNNTLCEH